MGLSSLPVIPGGISPAPGNGASGQEQCCAPLPAQGTVSPCPSQHLLLQPGRAGKGGISRGKHPGWGEGKGAATGWARAHCPLCPHGLPCRAGSWPRTHLQHCWPRTDMSDPCSPLGTHRHRGDREHGQPGVRSHSLASWGVTGPVPLQQGAQATVWR